MNELDLILLEMWLDEYEDYNYELEEDYNHDI